MGYAPSKIGRVAIKEQSGWGTAQTSFSASDIIECEVTYPSLAQEALTTDVYSGDFSAPAVIAGSKAGAEMTLSGPLHGWSASTPGGDPTEHVEALLARFALGASSQDGYCTDLTGGSVDEINVTSGVSDHVGHAVLAPANADASSWDIGWINILTGNDYAVAPQMPNGVDNSTSTVLGSNTVYLTADTPANGLSLQWLGGDANSAITLYDGVVTAFNLTLDTKGQPRFSATLRFANWVNTGTGGAPAAWSYTLPQMPVAVGANGARVWRDGATSCLGSLSISITCEVGEVECHSADSGVSRYVVTNRTVSIEMQGAVSDMATLPAPGDSGSSALQIDLNSTPGRALSVLIPSPQVSEAVTIGDRNAVLAVTTKYVARPYDGDSGDNGAPADTAFRLAWL